MGSVATLAPGERMYLGYNEWLLHPDEAAVVLERGFAIVDGKEVRATLVGQINGYPHVKLWLN